MTGWRRCQFAAGRVRKELLCPVPVAPPFPLPTQTQAHNLHLLSAMKDLSETVTHGHSDTLAPLSCGPKQRMKHGFAFSFPGQAYHTYKSEAVLLSRCHLSDRGRPSSRGRYCRGSTLPALPPLWRKALCLLLFCAPPLCISSLCLLPLCLLLFCASPLCIFFLCSPPLCLLSL